MVSTINFWSTDRGFKSRSSQIFSLFFTQMRQKVSLCLSFGECTARVKIDLTDFKWLNEITFQLLVLYFCRKWASFTLIYNGKKIDTPKKYFDTFLLFHSFRHTTFLANIWCLNKMDFYFKIGSWTLLVSHQSMQMIATNVSRNGVINSYKYKKKSQAASVLEQIYDFN